MKIVINDANILIDLVQLKLLKQFSELPFELYTTDVVYDEIHVEQKETLDLLQQKGILNIIEIEESSDDYQGIFNLLSKSRGLSFEDCTVWFYSKKMEGTLLTGDGQLRKCATKDKVEVRGIIYIFDELVKNDIIDLKIAIIKIKELESLNIRLPKKEINKRVANWQRMLNAE